MTRGTRVLAVMLMVTTALSGCARFNATPDVPGAISSSAESATVAPTSETLDANGMRPGVVPQTRVEPPSGANRPDGPPSTPDSELTDDDLSALLTSPASGPATADSCTGADLRLSLSGADFALGHRYARLLAESTSDRSCQLRGWPGLGLRGTWGTPFTIVAERLTTPIDWVGAPMVEVDSDVLVLAAGTAFADVEWTGSLGGNQDEHASLIVVQLVADATPVAVVLGPEDNVDIGPDTTVRIGTWRPSVQS